MLVPKVNARFSFKDLCFAFYGLIANKQAREGIENEFYLNHARAGLRIAISALGLPKGSKIGVSTYNCYTVMNAIHQAGCSVAFLDTDDDLTLDLQDLEKKKSDLSALIVTHLFGLPNDMDKIKEICPDIPIIEDCAHSFLSLSPNYKTGSIGDFAVYSIGPGKFPSIGDGGVLQVNNKRYIQKVKEEVKALKGYTFIEEVILILRLKLISIFHNPFIYKWISLPKKKKQQKRKNINSNYRHKESLMAKSVNFLFFKKQKKYKSYVQLQQTNAKKILSELEKIKIVTLPSINFDYNNCFMLPLLHPHRDNFAGTISRCGIEIVPHFAKSIVWAKEFGYQKGSNKNAEKIAEQILVVPVHYNMKEKNIQKIIQGLKTINN